MQLKRARRDELILRPLRFELTKEDFTRKGNGHGYGHGEEGGEGGGEEGGGERGGETKDGEGGQGGERGGERGGESKEGQQQRVSHEVAEAQQNCKVTRINIEGSRLKVNLYSENVMALVQILSSILRRPTAPAVHSIATVLALAKREKEAVVRIIRDIHPPRVHAVPLPIEEGLDAPPPLSLQLTVTPAAVAQGWETNKETKGETKEKESDSPTVSALKSTLLILSVTLKGVAITVSRPPLGGGRAPGTSKGRRVEGSKWSL